MVPNKWTMHPILHKSPPGSWLGIRLRLSKFSFLPNDLHQKHAKDVKILNLSKWLAGVYIDFCAILQETFCFNFWFNHTTSVETGEVNSIGLTSHTLA